MNDCERFWAHADHIPLDDVIAYWCELSGHSLSDCRIAKQAAICSAIDRGDIEYRRTDSKPFDDDVYVLASQKRLLVEKESFNKWAKQFAVAPTLNKPIGVRERDTLLKLIVGMAASAYRYDPKAAKNTAPKDISDDLAKRGMVVSDETVRKYLKEATETVLPANSSIP